MNDTIATLLFGFAIGVLFGVICTELYFHRGPDDDGDD